MIVWAFFVLAIGAVWLFGVRANFVGAAWAIAVVMVEVIVLGLNDGRCPLGNLASRYTDDRAANFDIYLPTWLAARTKSIFGTLFVGGVIFVLARWVSAP